MQKGTKHMRNNRGGIAGVVAIVLVVICICVPIGAVVLEKSITQLKMSAVADCLEAAATTVHGANDVKELGKGNVKIDVEKLEKLLIQSIQYNLKVDENFIPKEGSIATGRVKIIDLEIMNDELPKKCNEGREFETVGYHIIVEVPIKPSLVSKVVGGEEITELPLLIHKDIEMPFQK